MRFEIRDTGPGVPESMRDRLFTPFYQGELGQARKTGGTGLGLAISRHLVELMGGTIGLAEPRADEHEGEEPGSVFWFEVPLVSPEYSAPPRSAPPMQSAGQPPRILVVDDNRDAREFVAGLARKAGGRVSAASSGDEALSLLRAAVAEGEPFATCLIDQNMPHMDGWRLASEITGDTAINSARLILMAPVGTIGADAKMKLLRWFNGYIAKPVKPTELFEAIAKAMSAEVDLEGAETQAATEREEPQKRFEGEVLVAEDHEVNRELFTILLERLGCRVATARDGFEAVEIGSMRHFDLVLMDIFMPRMNGYEATQELRYKGFAGPIVAVTASALKGEREKCIAAGMDDILVKPFKKKDLAAVLAAWLSPTEKGIAAATNGTLPPVRDGAAGAVGKEGASDEDPTVFDWTSVLDTFLGQRSTVAGLLARFIEKAENQETELAEALEAGDFIRFREVAHSLKGAAWNLSARRLGDAAMLAEEAGRDCDEMKAIEALAGLRSAFAAFAETAGPYAME